MIKTVILNGAEQRVDGLGGQNANIINFSSVDIYASPYPGIIPDADSVAAIPAGSAVNLRDTCGTVYLLGTGKVQLEGTDYSSVNVSLSPGGSRGGSSGGEADSAVLSEPTALAGQLSETVSGLVEFQEA